MRNEEAGAFAAGADAQVSGRPTAVLGSSGPGSVHLLNGLYDCQRNGSPVFAIATHIPSAEIGTGYFQETAPAFIFEDCCNYVGTISSATQMPRISELALQAAILGRGVGMVILPGDIAAAEVRARADPPAPDHPATGDPTRRRRPGPGRDHDQQGRARSSSSAATAPATPRAEVLELSDKLKAPDRLRLPRQGRARGRQPERGRDDRTPRLGRGHRGAPALRSRADARDRLLLPRLPAGLADDHPGRRQRVAPRPAGERRPRPHRRRGGDAAGPAPAAHRTRRHATSSTRSSSTTTRT